MPTGENDARHPARPGAGQHPGADQEPLPVHIGAMPVLAIGCLRGASDAAEDHLHDGTRSGAALSRLARKLADRWMQHVVQDIRAGRCDPPEHSAARIIAFHRDGAGNLLDAATAGVELLNVIRPVVAVSVFITFIAHALHCHPECRRLLRDRASDYRHLFVQEARRFYRFFPAEIAGTRRDFEWRGYRFPAGRRVMLDLYGTDHDERTWQSPETFEPERFRRWDESSFNFIPQGGGDHELGHRCAGEWLTIALMEEAVQFLTQGISYTVPEQDLRIDWFRLPALPRSRMRIGNVRLR